MKDHVTFLKYHLKYFMIFLCGGILVATVIIFGVESIVTRGVNYYNNYGF